jgi:phospho-N-acetylmuramoyl-pentapeptide-transferase
VIVQVGWYKLTRRRVFRCAPLHHHFQLLGWPEPTIVRRMWVAAALCAGLGLAAYRMNGKPLPNELSLSQISQSQ